MEGLSFSENRLCPHVAQVGLEHGKSLCVLSTTLFVDIFDSWLNLCRSHRYRGRLYEVDNVPSLTPSASAQSGARILEMAL